LLQGGAEILTNLQGFYKTWSTIFLSDKADFFDIANAGKTKKIKPRANKTHDDRAGTSKKTKYRSSIGKLETIRWLPTIIHQTRTTAGISH
jgi:hypothetical protein